MSIDLLTNDPAATDAGSARRRSRRRSWILGLVIFIAGIAVGAAGMVGVQTWRFKQMQKHFDPTDMPRQIAKALRVSAEVLYVQAGMLEPTERSEVRDAIVADAAITERQKQVLLDIYTSFVQQNEAVAVEATSVVIDEEPGTD